MVDGERLDQRGCSHDGKSAVQVKFVRVVCQNRHGALVVDRKPPPAQQAPSTVWDRLDDGSWISDVYTTMPKVPGDTPPLGLPVC